MEKPRSVYVHIPFCAKMCHYCDFATYTVKGQPVDDYLEALEAEMRLVLSGSAAQEVETIFVGGGTPTILSVSQMERLLTAVRAAFPQRANKLEFTMEANPGTVNAEKLAVMREGGVNRLSFGAQSFDNGLLRRIGRDHDAETVLQSIAVARDAGFTNVSLDLMFGLPGQTVAMMEQTIETALQLDVPHFSAYALIVEENTRFYHLQRQGRLPLPTDDEEYEMYQLIRERMACHGYRQYEVSNFCREGFASRHNKTYWLNEPYYGFGVGAHGFVAGQRYANVRGVKPYITVVGDGQLPRVDHYDVSRNEDMENVMILGLRLRNGVSFARFAQRFGVSLWQAYGPTVRELVREGLLEHDDEGVRLTEAGLLRGNDVFARFLA